MNHKRRAIIAANAISELKTYSLGGYDQKVLIEGKYKTNPIMIFLHGGPGAPIPFCAGGRGLFPEITDRFILVLWDQLGCGINNHKVEDSFTIDFYIDMTVELIQAIKKEFPDNAICLFGVSWGSILAAKAAQRVPDLLHRVMTYGQILKQLTFNEEVFHALKSSKLPAQQQKRLENIMNAEKHSIKDLKLIMTWIRKYTEGYQATGGGKMSIARMIGGILTSPDYSLRDFKAIIINGYLKNQSLLTEIITIDLSDILCNLKVPYLIIQGSTDIVTSTAMISAFTQSVNNKNIVFHCVQNSAHMPSKVGMDYMIKVGFDFLENNVAETIKK
jgi:Predicted hydrolases or acyltransferases (alpha/beta hydrolase superfamily)